MSRSTLITFVTLNIVYYDCFDKYMKLEKSTESDNKYLETWNTRMSRKAIFTVFSWHADDTIDAWSTRRTWWSWRARKISTCI